MDQKICPHLNTCGNSTILSRAECGNCGKKIKGNHLHDVAQEFRLCEKCSAQLIANKKIHNFQPKNTHKNEKKICTKYGSCYKNKIYSMLNKKKCSICGIGIGSIHYHDVTKNTRQCLKCYLRKQP